MEKKITIVTINKNNPIGLMRTYQSIKSLLQINESIEWVLIDGQSSGNDIDLLSDLFDDPRIKIVSEKDDGIYDAMNKGWKIASGTHVLFLNSGDFIFPTEFQKLFRDFLIDELADIVYAKVQLFDRNLNPGIIHGPSDEDLRKNTIAHMSAITSKKILSTLNGFNKKYKIAADRDFFIRAKKAGFVFRQFDYIVAGFPQDGISTQFLKTRLEDLAVSKEHGFLTTIQYYWKTSQAKIKSLKTRLKNK